MLAAVVIGLGSVGIAAPPDHAGGPGGNSGASPAQAASSGPPTGYPASKPGASSDQDAAQRAVLRHEALPLSKIIGIAEKLTEGRVINARLLRVSGVLLYQLTVLNSEGRSWRDYYSAASGNPVVLP